MRQIGFLVFEVVHFKERGRAFAGRRSEDGRVDERKAVRIEVVANGLDDFVANAYGGVLTPAAQPEMAMVHQEIYAMIFGRNRIRFALRNALQYASAFHIQLVSAGRSRFFPNLARHGEGRLLREVLQFLEELLIEAAFHRNALHGAGAIAH